MVNKKINNYNQFKNADMRLQIKILIKIMIIKNMNFIKILLSNLVVKII